MNRTENKRLFPKSNRAAYPTKWQSIVFRAVHAWVRLRYRKQFQWYVERTEETAPRPNPVVPQTVNDKFFWRKLFDHDPRFTVVSDNLAVRQWVSDQNLGLATPPVLWSGRHAKDIPNDVLDGDVVVKANHAYKTNIFVHGGKYRRRKLVAKADRFLKRDHGVLNLQWGYLNIKRRLFVEEQVGKSEDLIECKFFSFGGKLIRLSVIRDRFGSKSKDIWETDGTGAFHLTDNTDVDNMPNAGLPLPPLVDAMQDIAGKIGAQFDHVRVDLMTDGRNIWFSELTLYNHGGLLGADGTDPDYPGNAAWDIRRSWFLTEPQTGWRKLYASALLAYLNKCKGTSQD